MFKLPNRIDSIGISFNRIYLTLFILLIGTCSSVFAIDISQAFSQANEQSAWIDSLFKWKSTISNLYSKALKLAKDKEVVATTASFDQLKKYFTTCVGLETADFINILYHSNFSFKNTFDLIFPPWTKEPTTIDINKSYNKFFVCRKISTPTSTDIENLNNEINGLYYDVYINTYTMSTLNKPNFWSDLFWNGTLDDSDFDLLYDINQVGKILFENFTDSPEILFYRLPKSPTSSNGGNSSSSNQNAYQLWGGGWSFPGTTWWPSWGGSSSSSWWWSSSAGTSTSSSTTTTTSTTTSSPSTSSPIADNEVQSFIESTNPSASSNPAGVALVFWNQCLTSETPAPIVEEPAPLMTPEEYISGINNFINNANIDDVINTNLLTEFNNNNPLPPGWSTSDSWYAESIANAYAEQALGGTWAPGTCEYSCNGLSLDKQAQCELNCSKSCIQKCDGLWLQDKLLCISDCTCFLIAGPNGAWWAKMEDMFRIKFCKVPVQTQRVAPWKTVFSIQAIFQEISDVLNWLRDSGKMVKFSKTKEFLDSNIKIKFADNFAFKLQVGFKPVFLQKSTTIKIKEQSQANTDLNIAVLDMNTSAPKADNYNKYIVVADPISNDAWLEPANSLSEITQNIQKTAAAASAATHIKLSDEAINGVITSYAQNINILFVQNTIEFLKDNQLFLQNLSEALLDINNMSLELKTRIENSK